VEHLRNRLAADNTLTEQVVIDGTAKETDTYDAIEVVLKGPEVSMGGAYYCDKDANQRHHARLRWWDGASQTLRAGAQIPAGTELFTAKGTPLAELPDTPLTDNQVEPYDDGSPVLFGHYWWRKGSSETINTKATCVDFSVAKNGVLATYRWNDGDTELATENFVNC